MYRLFYDQLLVRIDAERAHAFGVSAFRYGAWAFRLGRAIRAQRGAPAPVEAMGITFPGRLGLAAGMDKNADAVVGLSAAGFAFVEVGTVTAHGQPGNERPRSWRELDVHGLRNRMGFNNEGADAVAARLARLRSTAAGHRVVLGVNIGKTKATPAEDAASDYAYSATRLAPYADYLVVNVSSPNTPGLRDLQSTESLRPILTAVREAADGATAQRVPLLVKIAPDLADADVDAVADLAVELGLDGIIATNTTIAHERGPGGLSGPPVRARAVEVVARLKARAGDAVTIIGVGGIENERDARALLEAGATLLQTYTGFVYQGPGWVARLNASLGA
ncbi:quinone-dependent dihydroorotate dehydrogenase [Demequina activiva]|uniref:Dihydroorotate dehydrogenase (quinone) n=1 Tax=Demequina activiva TaxID=1582364 RepID=A0A919Q5K0_9MICO|nr:quinone-dependent dihydroorotate dehydrogenase [Demequina activiva]GIG55577.1 dihydroorotate dehydrogenase (quinone) [Demequina activiva]